MIKSLICLDKVKQNKLTNAKEKIETVIRPYIESIIIPYAEFDYDKHIANTKLSDDESLTVTAQLCYLFPSGLDKIEIDIDDSVNSTQTFNDKLISKLRDREIKSSKKSDPLFDKHRWNFKVKIRNTSSDRHIKDDYVDDVTHVNVESRKELISEIIDYIKAMTKERKYYEFKSTFYSFGEIAYQIIIVKDIDGTTCTLKELENFCQTLRKKEIKGDLDYNAISEFISKIEKELNT